MLSALVWIDVLIIPVQIGANGRRRSEVLVLMFGNSFIGVGRPVQELNVHSLVSCIIANGSDIRRAHRLHLRCWHVGSSVERLISPVANTCLVFIRIRALISPEFRSDRIRALNGVICLKEFDARRNAYCLTTDNRLTGSQA